MTNSVPPTPKKENNSIMSYSDTDSHVEKMYLDKGLFDRKETIEKKKSLEFHRSYSIEVPGLPIVAEDKMEFNNSKSFQESELPSPTLKPHSSFNPNTFGQEYPTKME